ncbi:MAG: lipoprotein insertase outer membrane protein LolB [Propionivibrio sp.]
MAVARLRRVSSPMVRLGRLLVAASLLGVLGQLGGCAILTPTDSTSAAQATRESLRDFSLIGRFSLRQDDESYSGQLDWRHAGVDNELLLSSPFGQGIAEIVTGADGAKLTTSEGRIYYAPDAEALTRQVLGYTLPLTQLTDWVRARTGGDGTVDQVKLDEQGRPRQLRHESWRIDYGYDSDDPAALPGVVFVERAGRFELRLRIDQWSNLDDRPVTRETP